MLKLQKKYGLPVILTVTALMLGCIVSGTFVITKALHFTAANDLYYYQVDITDNSDWKEHEDEIQFVDAVGMVLFVTSTEPADATFSVYVDEYSPVSISPAMVPTSATVIIEDFVIPSGQSVITYSESVKAIQNLDTLKTLVKSGKFDFYGTSSGTVGNTITVDSGKVVVTFSAGT